MESLVCLRWLLTIGAIIFYTRLSGGNSAFEKSDYLAGYLLFGAGLVVGVGNLASGYVTGGYCRPPPPNATFSPASSS